MTYKILLFAIIVIGAITVIQVNADRVDLPPLVLIYPGNFTTTIDTEFYTYQVLSSAFIVVDDDGKTPVITCEIENEKNQYNPTYPHKQWYLSAGTYEVNCLAEDTTGNTSGFSWHVTINQDVLSPRWFKTIAKWYPNDKITQPLYLKVVKYMHTAGVLSFNITANDPPPIDPIIPPTFKQNTIKWASDVITNTQYKSILEGIAKDGIFENITI